MYIADVVFIEIMNFVKEQVLPMENEQEKVEFE